MNVTNYFINENSKYRKKLFVFQSLSNTHTNKIIMKIIVNILKIYKLKKRLFIVTTNNASNNKKMRKKIKNMLEKIIVK